MKKNKPVKRQFRIGILPIDEDGTRLYNQFGWYSPEAKNHKVFEFSKGMIFEDSGIDGSGSVQDWLNLIIEDHEHEWIVKATYIDNNDKNKLNVVERIPM